MVNPAVKLKIHQQKPQITFPEEVRQLRRAFLGNSKTAQPPLWVSVLLLAEKWGVPPWEVEEMCSQNWFERGLAYYDIIAEAQNKPRKSGKHRSRPKSKTGMEGMSSSGQYQSNDIELGNVIIPD